VAKKQQHNGWKVKILRLHELAGEVLGPIERVSINLSETGKVVESWVGLLEWPALKVAERKDWTSRAESDVMGLRAAMADGSAKIEGVQRNAAI
jgi:hypothetical protein